MHCKRCGKAIGTDRGICPFCGAMLSKDQYEIYKAMKKDERSKPKLLTEKYGEKKIIYEKREEKSNLLFYLLGILLLLMIVGIIIIIILLNK